MKLNYEKILAEAHKAGLAAGSAKVATPMTLVESDLFDNPIGKTYYVPEGPCGFAWVVTHEHGNGKFVKYLKSAGGGDKYYGGGYYVKWVREFGQSIEKKESYADAYAAVLKGYGIKAYSGSRLD
tara:strand:- start:429 stop:803 length:375 start_codon:yes stop_codon:yes gene_type:complete